MCIATVSFILDVHSSIKRKKWCVLCWFFRCCFCLNNSFRFVLHLGINIDSNLAGESFTLSFVVHFFAMDDLLINKRSTRKHGLTARHVRCIFFRQITNINEYSVSWCMQCSWCIRELNSTHIKNGQRESEKAQQRDKFMSMKMPMPCGWCMSSPKKTVFMKCNEWTKMALKIRHSTKIHAKNTPKTPSVYCLC